MLDYSVKIEYFQDRLQVIWIFNNSSCPPYLIDRGALTKVADEEIRPALRRLVTLATKGQLAQADEVLRDLARAGNRLYKIFFTVDGGAATQAFVNKIQEHVRARTDHPTIAFFVPPKVYIPWALMYDAPRPRSDQGGKIEHYSAFWCLKYGLATLYDYLASPLELDPAYQADSFRMLSAVDSSLLKKAASQLDSTSPETAMLTWLQSRYGMPVDSSESLLSEWMQRRENLGLLYFYCHSNQTKIGFSDTDLLDTIDFKIDYKKSAAQSRCLVFLNGCHTAAGAEHGGFLEATGREGFCGFVGAETTLPYLFAHRFGLALIAHLYGGLPLIDIMDKLRIRHWPLSLAYGLYAYPFMRVLADDGSAIPPMSSDTNYCDLAVGTDLV